GADEELSKGGPSRVIVCGYDGLPMLPVAPPSPNYIPGPEEPQTPPAPQDEDEHEPMFIQPHNPDFMPEPIYPEYIPLEDEHILPAEEQPLPPVVSPTTESLGGDDRDDDDDNSSRYNANDEDEDEEDEEEEEHLAPADSAFVIPTDEFTSISLPPEVEVERLLAMPTPTPSPLTSLSPPSAGERLARCTAPVALPSPLLPPSLYPPPPVDRRDDILESDQPPRKRLCLSTLGSREVGYAIRDTWIDPAEAVSEMAPTTLEEVNTRVIELAELHEHDTQDLYALLEDAQDDWTRISQRVAMDSQRVDLLMGDRMTLQETVWIMKEEAYIYLDELKHLSNLEYRNENKIAELKENFNGMSIEIRKKEKLLQQEQWAYLSTHPSKCLHSFCYDDDDEDYTLAVTPVLSTEEPDNSLSMGDKHLDTISATESDEFIKSSVENRISIPSEFEGIPDHMCDVPFHDNSPPLDVLKDQFEGFSESNDKFSSIDDDSLSFDKIDYVEASPPDSELISSEVMEIVILEVDAFLAIDDEPTSSPFPKSDDQSCSDEDVLEKIVSKPLFKEEIIPMKIDQHPDNAKFDLMESLRTHDSSLPISSKIDSLLDELAGELTLLKSISPRIDETDCDFKEDIHLIEKLLYDNSSPRPPKEFVSVNSDAESESFSSSPILVKDSDFFMDEIDLFCTPDYPMTPGFEDKDYDSKRVILIPKELPSNNTLSFAKK
nr:hypothetical protein [Tanacetum cinerariifolium]